MLLMFIDVHIPGVPL
jgi:hypothetical protein